MSRLTPALPDAEEAAVVRRAAIVLTTSAPTATGMAVLAPPASAADIVPRDLTVTALDGAIELPHRVISPARVSDVIEPVTIELPGIVHRFPPGHRLAVVLAGGDLAYRGSTAPQPVTLTTGAGHVQQLTLPVTP